MGRIVALASRPRGEHQRRLVMEGEQSVATVDLYLYHTKDRVYAEVHDLYVRPEDRRKGHAATLLEQVLQYCKTYAKEENIQVLVRLTSKPRRRAANNLYRSLGLTLLAKAETDGTNLYGRLIRP